MRNMGIAVLCAALAGCGSPSGGGSYGINQSGGLVSIPATPNWSITHKVDRMTDKPSTSITNTSKTAKITSKSGFTASILGLGCSEKGPHVSFYWGFPVGRNGVAVASYRFDSLPAQKPKANFMSTEMLWIEGPDARTFLQQLAQSSTLLIEINSVVGQASAEFDTSGADAALAELASCLQAPPVAQAPKAKSRT